MVNKETIKWSIYAFLLTILISESIFMSYQIPNIVFFILIGILILPFGILILSPTYLYYMVLFFSMIRLFPGYRMIINLSIGILIFIRSTVYSIKKHMHPPFVALLIVFIIYILYISINTLYWGVGLTSPKFFNGLKNMWKSLLWLYILMFIVEKPKDIINIFKIITVASLINTMVGIYQFVTHTGLKDGTVIGLVAQHVNFGNMCLLPLPFLYFYFLYTQNQRLKKIIFFLMIIEVIGILISYSRTTYISFTAFILLVAIKRRNLKQLTLIITIITIISLYFMPQAFWDRINSIIQIRSTYQNMYKFKTLSEIVRLIAIPAAWKIFLQHPIIGIGGGKFNYIWYNYSPIFYKAFMAPHNDYMRLLAEYGVVGFLLFLLVVLAYINTYKYVRNKFEGDNIKEVLLNTIHYSLIIILVTSLMDNNHLLFSHYLIFLLFISLNNLIPKEHSEITNINNY